MIAFFTSLVNILMCGANQGARDQHKQIVGFAINLWETNLIVTINSNKKIHISCDSTTALFNIWSVEAETIYTTSSPASLTIMSTSTHKAPF